MNVSSLYLKVLFTGIIKQVGPV